MGDFISYFMYCWTCNGPRSLRILQEPGRTYTQAQNGIEKKTISVLVYQDHYLIVTKRNIERR